MIQRFALTLFASACILALAASAQEPRPDKKEEKKGVKKEAPAGEEGNDQDKVKEILSRLDDNYGKATERLDKKDSGTDTRKIQEEIIKDLDELIKQKQKSQGGGGGGGGKSSGMGQESPEGGQSGGSSQQQSGGKSSKGGQQKNPMALNEPQKSQGGGQGQEKKNQGQAQAGPNKEEQEQEKKQGSGAGAKENEEKKGQTGGTGVGNSSPKEKNTIADLYPGVWGMLPASERNKMDVYSRERFMPRYEDLLRQYYRTIAEQGKRNEGD